jgi:hypothetical protein
MPHVDDSDQVLPKTPPRQQAPIPKPESQAGAATKAKVGLLPTLSIADFKPNPDQVDRALGMQDTEVPLGNQSDPNLRFRQPEYGRGGPLSSGNGT